eukprot:448651-Alexandrium_andersonii.AAC.1
MHPRKQRPEHRKTAQPEEGVTQASKPSGYLRGPQNSKHSHRQARRGAIAQRSKTQPASQ